MMKKLQEKILHQLAGEEKTPTFPQLKWLTKEEWSSIGDTISQQEHALVAKAPRDKVITLRLDGANFSSQVKKLRQCKILEEGISPTFAEIMNQVAWRLHDHFHALLTHNHSDEITLILPPLEHDSKSEHLYGGKHDKMVTLAASLASGVFTREILKRAKTASIELPDNLIFQFDCRMGLWDSVSDAMTLVWWRSYDAIINGVSDTLYHSKVPISAKEKRALPTFKKLALLEEHKVHVEWDRIFGCTTVYVPKKVDGMNPLTKEATPVIRKRIEQHHGNLVDIVPKYALLLIKKQENDKSPATETP